MQLSELSEHSLDDLEHSQMLHRLTGHTVAVSLCHYKPTCGLNGNGGGGGGDGANEAHPLLSEPLTK